MKKLLLALATLTFIPPAFASVDHVMVKKMTDPNTFTQSLSSNLFDILKFKQAEIKHNPNILKGIVKEEIMPHVNFKYAGSMILGNYFKTFTQEEREQFFAVLENYFVTTYAQTFTLYKGQETKFYPTQQTGDIVKTRIDVYQGQPVKIFFSLRKNSKTGEWQVYDIVAEGISLVETKKGEWSNYFKSKEKFNQLIEELKKSAKQPIVIK